MRPTPPGCDFPPHHPLCSSLSESVTEAFPEAEAWRRAQIYLHDHNAGISAIARDSPLFDHAYIADYLQPPALFENFHPVETIGYQVEYLRQGTEPYELVADAAATTSTEAWA